MLWWSAPNCPSNWLKWAEILWCFIKKLVKSTTTWWQLEIAHVLNRNSPHTSVQHFKSCKTILCCCCFSSFFVCVFVYFYFCCYWGPFTSQSHWSSCIPTVSHCCSTDTEVFKPSLCNQVRVLTSLHPVTVLESLWRFLNPVSVIK